MCQPIPVTDRLPEPNTPQGEAFVLAYDMHLSWVAAVYHPVRGWTPDTNGHGMHCDPYPLTSVTHWLPYPPAPEGL